MNEDELYPDKPKLAYDHPDYDEVFDAWHGDRTPTVNQGKRSWQGAAHWRR